MRINRPGATKMHRTTLLSLALAFSILFVGVLNADTAGATATYSGSFGSSGSGSGQFDAPLGIAVNATSGDIYVVDRALNRVSQFDSSGTFIRMWGRNVNQDTAGDICTAASGDTCQTGIAGSFSGQFNSPQGIAVDDTTGAVYVQDSGSNRIQKFTANGTFITTWGKAVDQQNAGNFCTAASGHTCQAGLSSGSPAIINPPNPEVPAVPSENGVFRGWSTGFISNNLTGITVDDQGFVYVTDPSAIPFPRVQKFDPTGVYLGKVAPASETGNGTLAEASSPLVTENGDLYVMSGSQQFADTVIHQFAAVDFSNPERLARRVFGFEAGLTSMTIDPSTGFIVALAKDCRAKPGQIGAHVVMYNPSSGQEVDCTFQVSPSVASAGGTAAAAGHKLYVTDATAHKVHIFTLPSPEPPDVGAQRVSEITTNGARVDAQIAGNLAETTFHVEYGPQPCSSNPCQSTSESESIGASFAMAPGDLPLSGLTPDTGYFYRVVATNASGTDAGTDRHFSTFAEPTFDPSCANNLARQQTGAAFLLDCRAYELVSAENQGGYNVVSDLVPGQSPLGGYPGAPGKAMYSVHSGGIPGTGNPTNRGPDPYLATRDADNQRWNTRYVGIPADVPSDLPFSSTLLGADAVLDQFAFSGPDICDPCFPDGSQGIPVRNQEGELEQGMVGSMPVANPVSAGQVNVPYSADGSHLVFGSEQQFETLGNPDNGNVTIYDRDLESGVTQVVSTDTTGTALTNGADVAELDISSDGSRILIGELVSTDPAGNDHWHLYMHVGTAAQAIDLTPGAPSGVLFNGMTADGTKVYFSTDDPLVGDGDTSMDVFRSDVGSASATISRVSTGISGTGDTDSCNPAANSYNSKDWNAIPGGPTDCSTVAIGGGGLASEDGSIFLLSPELLAGPSDGVAGAPNLFVAAPGSGPEFVTTLESSASQPLKAGAHAFQKSFGTFTNPEGVAIDHVTGSTYVLDTGKTEFSPGSVVKKYTAAGNLDTTFGTGGEIDGSNTPTGPFLESGEGSSFGSPFGAPMSIAFDNRPGHRALFVPDLLNGVIDKFDVDGNYISQFAAGFPVSVAVNQANGNVYTTSLFGSAEVFDEAGAPVAPFSFPVGAFFSFTAIAVDSSGNSYVVDGANTRKFTPAGVPAGTLHNQPSFGAAIDPADDHVYVSAGNSVFEFDATGTQVGLPFGEGKLAKSIGLAVDGGRVVASNGGGGNVVSFGPATTPAERGYDSPLVIDSVKLADERRTYEFEVTPGGAAAVFTSTLPITGFDNGDQYEVFRYDSAAHDIDCVSCNPTGQEPVTDSRLATNGRSMADDGRVFFTTGEPLVLRDSNGKLDAYEWDDEEVELVSSGTSFFNSGLLSVTGDGTDAFFFTRQILAGNDGNGNLMKLYDARAGGGFFVIPPPPQCAASDECHGAGSQPPAAADINTGKGTGGNAAQTKTSKPCKAGFVRRKGKCVKKPRRHKSHRHSNGRGK
jgi:DNA-binding beta-propeller fold protein YncE